MNKIQKSILTIFVPAIILLIAWGIVANIYYYWSFEDGWWLFTLGLIASVIFEYKLHKS